MTEPDSSLELIERLRVDQRQRWLAGERVLVESYVEDHPELERTENEEAYLDFIYSEFCLRRELQDHVEPTEYLQRFPQIADRLEALFEVDEAMETPTTELRQALQNAGARFPFRLNCPHCHNPIEVVTGANEDEVLCPSCGSSFHLDPNRTQTWSKDKLPTLGKFELLDAVGRGAFGVVYRARDKELDRIVAVKVPRSGQLVTDEDEDRFVREARNVAQLNHPGIVPVYEAARSETFPYIVSEFVEGYTLSDALTDRRFGFRESAQLVEKISEALEHAHSKGVVHRDLKPSNIIRMPNGTPRVMDFGLAKRDAGEVTVTLEGQVLGTPAYMSPEQASGKAHHVDGRSDVYSLGVILFELLTGELPFRGNQRMLLHHVIHDEPRAPRSLNDRTPRDLETICLKAMAKEPARRYQTAQAMADDLTRYLIGQPILARPVGRLQRSWRWCRRNPVVAGLTTAVILVLALGTIVSSYLALEAVAEKSRADQKAAEALASAADARTAEAEADAQAKRTLTEAKKATRVAQFLAGMFEASAPYQHSGIRFTGYGLRGLSGTQDPAKLTSRELLDRGARRIKEELKDQPAVQASLMDTIGNVYIGLGLLDEAEPLLTSALEIRQSLHSQAHLETADSWYSLATLRLMQYSYEEAIVAARAALKAREELLDEDDERVVDARFTLAFSLSFDYRTMGEAERLWRSVLDWRRAHLGSDDPETAFAMIGLAVIRTYTSDSPAESMKLIAEATNALSRDPVSKPIGMAMAGITQSRVLQALGQSEKAADISTKAVAEFLEFETYDHPLFAWVANHHLDCLRAADRFAQAKEFCREQLRRIEQGEGVNPAYVSNMCNCLLVNPDAKDLDIAIRLCRIALRPDRDRHQPLSYARIEVALSLAKVLATRYVDRGYVNGAAESEALINECIVRDVQINGAMTCSAAVRETANVFERRDTARAENVFKVVSEQLTKDVERAYSQTPGEKLEIDEFAESILEHIAFLRKHGKTPEAESLCRKSIPLTRKHKDEYYTIRMTHDLALIADAQGRSETAEQLFRESLELCESLHRKNQSVASYWTRDQTRHLADLLAKERRFTESEREYRRVLDMARAALAQQRKSHKGDKLRVDEFALIVSTFAAMLRRSGQIEQAESLYRESLPLSREHVDEYYTMRFTMELASLARDQGRLKDAERLFDDATQCADAYARTHPHGDSERRNLISVARFFATKGIDWDVEFFHWTGPMPPPDVDSIRTLPLLASLRAEKIDFDWGEDAPVENVPPDNFAMIATAEAELAGGRFLLSTASDDGVRVVVDDRVAINNWTSHSGTIDEATIDIEAGVHSIRIEYFDSGRGATIKFSLRPQQPAALPPPPQSYSVFAPELDEADVAALTNLLQASHPTPQVSFVKDLDELAASNTDVGLILVPRNSSQQLADETITKLREKRLVAIGYGAGMVFKEMGLQVNSRHCAHGFPVQTTIQRNTLFDAMAFPIPVTLLLSPPQDQGKLHNVDCFGLHLGSNPKLEGVEIIALLNQQYALAAREGLCVLIGLDAPLSSWSAEVGRLIVAIASGLKAIPSQR